MCPSQWEGKLSDGRAIYIRFRWGTLRASAGDTLDDAIDYGTAPLGVALGLLVDKDGERDASDVDTAASEFQSEVDARRALVPGGELLYHQQISDDLDGALSTEEMLTRLRDVDVIYAL